MRSARIWKSAVFAALALLASGMVVPSSLASQEVIYHAVNEKGIPVLTNRKTSSKLQVYLVFRDILRRFSDIGDKEILRLAEKHSIQYGLDPRLVQAVIEVESGYKAEAVSHAGAEGVMQIMPGTQVDLGVTRPFDPDDNIRGGVKYLRMMLNRFGSLELALAAYNAGPGQVEKHGGVPPFQETENYVKLVMGRYERLRR